MIILLSSYYRFGQGGPQIATSTYDIKLNLTPIIVLDKR